MIATIPGRDGTLAGGVALSAHTDVVPTEGQDWSKRPYELSAENGRLFGRGTTDMKGFVAAALKAVLDAADADLERPVAPGAFLR